MTPDLVNVLGAFRADIAVYESGRPFAVIELKIFDAASPLPSVGLELDKAQILARFAKLRILVGVMICPIIVSLEARIERLHDAFGGRTPTFTRPPMAVVFCMRFSATSAKVCVRTSQSVVALSGSAAASGFESEHLRITDTVTTRIDEYALAFCLGMIFSENRIPLFRIMP
jgi:hypothetical protein